MMQAHDFYPTARLLKSKKSAEPSGSGRAPVAGIIDTVGNILLFHVGSGEAAGVVGVHRDGNRGGLRGLGKGYSQDRHNIPQKSRPSRP